MHLLNYNQLLILLLHRLFGIAGTCNSCQQMIPPDEMVMRCQSMVFHMKCFNCAHCHSPLLPGERYLLLNGSLFCEHEFPRLLPSDWQPTTPPNLSTNGQASPPTSSHPSSASPNPLRSIMSSAVIPFALSQPNSGEPSIGMFTGGGNEISPRNPFPASSTGGSVTTSPVGGGNNGGSVANANRSRQKVSTHFAGIELYHILSKIVIC